MGEVLSYFDELSRAMEIIGQDPKSIFIGQGVGCAGTTMTDTLAKVPSDKLIEFPVAEDMQMGTAIGMALEGWKPVCIFPRWNFMVCATNQIVNHLDRLPIYSQGQYNPKVIIRVASPKTDGFDPGPQHSDDFTEAFRLMCKRIKIVCLRNTMDIVPEYLQAMRADHSTMMVEYTSLYKAIPSGVGR